MLSRPSTKLVSIPALFFLSILFIKFYFLDYYDSELMFTFIWRAIVISGALVVGYSYLSRITTRYMIDFMEASICDGIFSKRTLSAPLNKITNYELRRPFMKRLFGLADLYIDTPGTDAVEIKMTELNLKEAVKLRDYLSATVAEVKE